MHKTNVSDALGPIAILGGGNVGQALARGWLAAGKFRAADMTLTRRRVDKLAEFAGAGYNVSTDNRAAVERARQVLVAVQPQQLNALLLEIREALDPKRHTLISVVSGVTIGQIHALVGTETRNRACHAEHRDCDWRVYDLSGGSARACRGITAGKNLVRHGWHDTGNRRIDDGTGDRALRLRRRVLSAIDPRGFTRWH